MENSYRTFIYKTGDIEADSMINEILDEGWKITAVTPNGSIRIATFNKDYTCEKTKSVVN